MEKAVLDSQLSALSKITPGRGKQVRTIEGEARDGRLSRVQQAYVEAGAVQCGLCTPGFVMATTAFVEKCPGPQVSDETIFCLTINRFLSYTGIR